jgi:hypothetical protein
MVLRNSAQEGGMLVKTDKTIDLDLTDEAAEASNSWAEAAQRPFGAQCIAGRATLVE